MSESVTYYPPELDVGERLRLRFASLRRDPLFHELVRSYVRAWDQDDDDTCMEIERTMMTALRAYGQRTPAAICANCGRPRRELTMDYEQECDSCKSYRADRERRQRDWEERWSKMSPHEKAEHQRVLQLCIGGLISRDVQ